VARTPEHTQPHVIEEIESVAEHFAEWVRDHLALSIALLVIILGTAAGVGIYLKHRTQRAEAAADALDRVESSYMQAMGADPGALTAPELANPKAAAEVRSEFAPQFAEVAEEHPGTVGGALARFEQGGLLEADGNTDGAVDVWQAAIAELGGNANLRAIFQQRIGQAYDDAGRWLEAAEAYEKAGATEGYPLRYQALAEAARCLDQAGETERAKELAQRINAESPHLMVPQELDELLAELRQIPTS